MCIRCSGIHRSLGVHITFVRSVSIDEWKERQVEVMVRWGNKRANEYWEAGVPEDYYIPDENDGVGLMERWIRDKYEKGKFKAKGEPKCLSTKVDLSLPIPQIMALAAGTASGAAGGSKKKAAEAAAAATAAAGGGGGGGASSGAASVPAPKAAAAAKAAPAAKEADPFDLLGFDAFPVSPKTAAAAAAAAAGTSTAAAAAAQPTAADPFGFSFISQGSSSTSAAPAAAAAAAPQPASKAADIMSLFGAPQATAAQQQQQQQQQMAYQQAQAQGLAGAPGGLSLGQAPQAAVNPFAQQPSAFAQQPAAAVNPFSAFAQPQQAAAAAASQPTAAAAPPKKDDPFASFASF